MSITFEEASKGDIDELIRLRIAYIADDFGYIDDYEKECIERQLSDYFDRELGDKLVAFVAKDEGKIVSVAYLNIIEMPANPTAVSGLCGSVLNVYTDLQYRGNGFCTQLMKNLIAYGKQAGLGRVDLSATKDGYSIYKKVGFVEKTQRYTEMRYRY